MKSLILVRHAKSSWGDPAQRDIDRPLNDRGRQDAPLMAERLANRGIRPQRIICSPALRTVSTAEIFARQLSIPPGLLHLERQIYLASSEHLLQLIRLQDDNIDCVMLVGHNPAITDLFNELCQDARLDNMPTCGVAQLAFSCEHWADLNTGQAKLQEMDYPKKR